MKKLTLVSWLCAAVVAHAQGVSPVQYRPLDVMVNEAPMGQWTLLEQDGGFYATTEAMQAWRLKPPQGVAMTSVRGESWLPLFSLPGYRARFDFSNQSVALDFGSQAFTGTRLAPEFAGPAALSPAAPALFLNYDISHTASSSSGASYTHDTSALSEIGLALAAGTLVSSQVGINLGNNTESQPRQWRRLETTWTQDFQNRNLTLRLGDTFARPAMWGRSLFFGGLQIGTNFGLTPGFLSQPIPILGGTASSPGTVELYVNNALRQTSNVPAGPFTIENFTQLTGGGEARVVVRDLLGRESVLVQPFFTNNNLLAAGLSDWSVSTGRERYNLGIENGDYREVFASGLYRRGVSEKLTLETQANWSQDRHDLGLGFNAALAFQALGQVALVHSHDNLAGSGSKLLLGIDHQTLRSGFSARWVVASRDFRALGFGPAELPYQSEQSLNYRYTFDNQDAMTLGSARLEHFDTGANNMFSASYSTRVGERGALIFSGTQVSGNTTGYVLGVSLVLPLEKNKTLTSSVNRNDNAVDGYAAVNSPIGAEVGSGWRVLGGHRGGENLAEGGIYYQGKKSYWAADLSVAGSAQTLRLNAQGALVAMEGSVFAARRLSESFALVEVRGYPDVGVGFQGAPLTRTDENGLALLPQLAAYQRNNIRLDPNDLPFSAELDSIEQVAVPAWRGGVKVTFPVRSGRGALLRLLLDDGGPAPTGAGIELVGDTKAFFVARRGEAYVSGLQAQNLLQLKWKDQTCRLDVTLPPGSPDDIARLGPLLCKGVSR